MSSQRYLGAGQAHSCHSSRPVLYYKLNVTLESSYWKVVILLLFNLMLYVSRVVRLTRHRMVGWMKEQGTIGVVVLGISTIRRSGIS